MDKEDNLAINENEVENKENKDKDEIKETEISSENPDYIFKIVIIGDSGNWLKLTKYT